MAETVSYVVKDPAGNLRYLNGPAGASDDEIIEQAKIAFPDPADNRHPVGWIDTAANAIKDVARGAASVPASIAGGLTAAFGSDNEGLLPKENFQATDTGRKIAGLPEKLIPTPKGDSQGRTYVRKGLEGMGGALMGPGAVARPLATMLTGGLAGIGSEAGEQLTDHNPLGALGGGLLGGFLGGVGTAAHSTRQALVNQTLEGVDPNALTRGIQNMKDAKGFGVNLNLSQGMDQPSNIDATVNRLANSRHGVQTQANLRGQPGQLSMEAERELGTLPGDIRSPQVNANNTQEAADAAIRAGYKRATAAWQAEAPQGSSIPPQAVEALDKKLAALAKQYPNTSGADLIEEARAALINPAKAAAPGPQILGANGLPLNPQAAPSKYLSDALQIKGAIDDKLNTFGSRKLNTDSLDRTNLERAQAVRKAFRDVVDQYAPNLSKANQAFTNVMEAEVEPMKKSVLGRLAGQRGAAADLEAPAAKLQQVLNRGSTPGAKNSDILDLEKGLRGVTNGPEVFQDAIVSHIADKVTKATAIQEGRLTHNVAGNLEAAFGRENVAGTRDMLVGLARSKGQPDETYVNGFMNLLRYAGMAARRPGVVQGVTEADLTAAATSAGARSLSGVSLTRPWAAPLRGLNEWLSKDAHTFMDALLNSPEGAKTLQELGKKNWMSNSSRATIDTFLGTLAAKSDQIPAPVTQE